MASRLPAFFILLFLLGGFAAAVPATLDTARAIESPTLDTVIKGKWGAAFERKLTEAFAFYPPSRDFWGVVDYLLFHEGRKGVVVGTNGWLFTDEEFTVWPHMESQVDAHIKTIETVNAQLKGLKIPLVIALLPAKARLYEDNLGKLLWPKAHRNTYERTLQSLHARGIPSPDLLAVFSDAPDKENLFLRTDTHWSPAGARLTAQTLAKTVQETLPDVLTTKTPFLTQKTETKVHSGDLLRYIPLGHALLPDAPEPDQLDVFTTASPALEPAAGTDALFGEETLPIALVGTSYSANLSWNFAGFLKDSLQNDLLNAADEGRGPFVTMTDYLKSPAFQNNPPRLVIWEIPERYLSMPEKNDPKEK